MGMDVENFRKGGLSEKGDGHHTGGMDTGDGTI